MWRVFPREFIQTRTFIVCMIHTTGTNKDTTWDFLYSLLLVCILGSSRNNASSRIDLLETKDDSFSIHGHARI